MVVVEHRATSAVVAVKEARPVDVRIYCSSMGCVFAAMCNECKQMQTVRFS